MSLTKSCLIGAAPLVLTLFLGAQAHAADNDYSKGRKADAVKMCVDHAEHLLPDRAHNTRLEVAQMRRIDENNDKVSLGATLKPEDAGNRYTLPIECEVSFKGDNKITSFDDERFRSDARDFFSHSGRDNGNRGNDRKYGSNDDGNNNRSGKDREGVWRDAGQACRKVAQNRNFDVVDIDDRNHTQSGIRIRMDLKKKGQRYNAVCAYNQDRQEARLEQVDQQNRK